MSIENGGYPSKKELGLGGKSLIEGLSFELQQKYYDEQDLRNSDDLLSDKEAYILNPNGTLDFKGAQEYRENLAKYEDGRSVAICLVNGQLFRGSAEMREEFNTDEEKRKEWLEIFRKTQEAVKGKDD